MEEVDKIIIQSLIAIGCNINQDVKQIGRFDHDLFIESISKLLNTLSPNSESLPTKLPPNTGVKFRICTKFANICQQIGYKNEIGYQTFLYTNEAEMRRLLMFLVEKLTKDTVSSSVSIDKSENIIKNIHFLMAKEIKKLSNQFWIPPYCKLNGLKSNDDNSFTKEGCKFINGYHSVSLGLPQNYLNSKSQNSKELEEYVEKQSKFLTEQIITNSTDLLASLMEKNLNDRIKEQSILKQDINNAELKTKSKENSLNVFKDSIRKILETINNSSNSKDGLNIFSRDEMNQIELDFKSPKADFLLNKGSRFTHSEKLQFAIEENPTISLLSGSSDEKREEINNLKAKLNSFNQSYDDFEKEIKQTINLIEKLEQDCKDASEVNEKLEEKVAIKKRTNNLINDAPMNILKLREEIKNHEKKMTNLNNQWEAHKQPLKEQQEILKQKLLDRKISMQHKLNETKNLKLEIEKLNNDLKSKDIESKELNDLLEKISKDTNRTSRLFYTKRILEIVGNIDKQKKEIDKILIETKMVQKEINQLSGKLERIFNANDELLFKDAKKDETNKKVYKLFISINENYEQLINTIEQSSHIEREIRDLEDQITSESQNKLDENMQALLIDFKQIKEENEQLGSKVKSKK